MNDEPSLDDERNIFVSDDTWNELMDKLPPVGRFHRTYWANRGYANLLIGPWTFMRESDLDE